jgi:hypothetical protein
MVLKRIACGAAILCLSGSASADDVIYNGLHCNSLCQWWMGISPAQPAQKRECSRVLSNPAQYDSDLVQLCQFVLRIRNR